MQLDMCEDLNPDPCRDQYNRSFESGPNNYVANFSGGEIEHWAIESIIDFEKTVRSLLPVYSLQDCTLKIQKGPHAIPTSLVSRIN